ncbi:MAG: GAF domain-containing sensor histidine kinase [Endomicrobiales bacterium]|jgi:signal transduction histidine kinase
MKRLIIKYFTMYVAIITLITALWAASGYLWMHSVVKTHYTEVTRQTIEFLAGGMISTKINRPRIIGLLHTFMKQPDIVMSAVIHGKEKLVFARSVQKREQMIWPLRVSFPLYKGHDIIGWLRIWPSPEAVIKLFVYTRNRFVIMAFALSWFLCIIAPLFIFVRQFVFVPLDLFRGFVDSLDSETSPRELHLSHKEWREMYEKLKHLNGRIGDTNETMNMLFSVSQTLTSHLDVTDTFNVIMETAQKKFPGILAAIFLQRDDEFLCIRAQRGYSSEFTRSIHFKSGEGIGGQAFQKCQPMVVNDLTKEPRVSSKSLLETEGVASFIHIPLIAEGKCVGLLNIASRQVDFFDDYRQKTFAMIAKYISIVIRNAQLYERVQELNRRLETEVSSTTRELVQTNSRLIQKVREMKALSDIASVTSAKLDLPAIVHMTVDKILDLLSVQTAGVFLYNEESRELVPTVPFFGIRQQDFTALRFNAQESAVLTSVVNEGKNYLYNDSAEATRAMPVLASLLSIHSLLVVALRSGKKSIGVLVIANKINGSFTNDDLHIVELIADRISVIIDNMALYTQRENNLHELTVLQKISSAISSEPVWEKILNTIVSVTTQAFTADACFLALYDDKEKTLTTQAGAYYSGGNDKVTVSVSVGDTNSLIAMVFKEGEIFVSPDASIDPRVKSPTTRSLNLKSMMLIPLRAENKVTGVLLIGKQQANCYTKEHIRLATLIAHQAAIIIENAHLYENLREAKSELEQLNQIKNEFISMVSHELRTPITAIKGFIKVVLGKEAGDINPQQEKFLQIADRSIDRLTLLISDLLDISRIESGQFTLHLSPVSAGEIAQEIIRSISPELLRRKLKIKSLIADNFPQVLADRGRLTQVFDNLIVNSMKFTADGGSITVAAQDKGDFALFSVTDTGIGIDKKDHQKIFQKFYQASSGPAHMTPGTGLGLAIVKSIVEMHGGEIWVDSELGKGATFYFVIPRAKTEIIANAER